MNRHVVTITVMTMIIGAGGRCVQAQEVLRVDLRRTIEMALQENEDFKAKKNAEEKRFQQYREAKSAIYPRLDAAVYWGNNFQFPEKAKSTTDDYSLDAGLSASQLIWSFGKVGSAIRMADKFIAASRFETEITKQEVVYRAKVGYYGALLAQHSLGIVRQSLENARHNKKLLEQRSSGGRSAKPDLIKMDADIASRVPQVNAAKTVYSSALRSLRVLIGAQGGSTLELTEEFPSEYASLDLPVLAARLRDNEPTLNALRQNAAAMDDAVSIRKAEYYPTVSGFATWDHLGTGNSYDVGEENRDDYGVAGIKVSVPLWTSGQTSAQLQQARIDARNARLELKKTDKNLGLALDDALAEYDEYNETLAARNEAVKLAEESFSMYRDMFASGQISLSDLNDAELFLTSEKLKRETTLFNINVTLAKIEKLTGAGL